MSKWTPSPAHNNNTLGEAMEILEEYLSTEELDPIKIATIMNYAKLIASIATAEASKLTIDLGLSHPFDGLNWKEEE